MASSGAEGGRTTGVREVAERGWFMVATPAQAGRSLVRQHQPKPHIWVFPAWNCRYGIVRRRYDLGFSTAVRQASWQFGVLAGVGLIAVANQPDRHVLVVIVLTFACIGIALRTAPAHIWGPHSLIALTLMLVNRIGCVDAPFVSAARKRCSSGAIAVQLSKRPERPRYNRTGR
jgi:hypothetical protein